MLENPDNNKVSIHNYYQDIADIYVSIMVIYHPFVEFFYMKVISNIQC